MEVPMKCLIVYYSFEGNTELVAKQMQMAIGADILSIKPQKEMKAKGFSKYIWGGKQVLMKNKPKLEAFDVDIEQYDLLLLGSPVWAGSFAPAMNTFLADMNIQHKYIGLFCCASGGKGKVFEKAKQQLEGNKIVGEIEFINPLDEKAADVIEKASAWAKSCKTQVEYNNH